MNEVALVNQPGLERLCREVRTSHDDRFWPRPSGCVPRRGRSGVRAGCGRLTPRPEWWSTRLCPPPARRSRSRSARQPSRDTFDAAIAASSSPPTHLDDLVARPYWAGLCEVDVRWSATSRSWSVEHSGAGTSGRGEPPTGLRDDSANHRTSGLRHAVARCRRVTNREAPWRSSTWVRRTGCRQ
jgi:hypothetical protein